MKQLLDLFWNNHEYGLGTKIKTQYRSLILYHTDEQRVIAEKSAMEEEEKRPNEEITTKIMPAGTFYPAEEWVNLGCCSYQEFETVLFITFHIV